MPGRPQPGPSCPNCKTPSRYITSMLDVKRDRSVLIYRCDSCREEIWR
jgi:hydrogenase maturation factor